MPFHHILVPLDFSDGAEGALDSAIALAQQTQARLTLLHVVHIPPAVEVDLTPYLVDMEADAKRGMTTYLKRVREAGLVGDVQVQRGVPYREILDMAHTQHVDLIVMGTHGRTGLEHFFLGSVAEKVVRLAPCPVMVTRQPEATTTS